MGLNAVNARGCSVTRAANMATASGVAIAFTWDTALFNYNALWSSGTNPTRITVDKNGLYLITATNIYQAAVDNAAYIEVKVNGTAVARNTAGVATTLAGVGGGTSGISITYPLVSGDYVEIFTLQATGAINVKGNCTVALIVPTMSWDAQSEQI